MGCIFDYGQACGGIKMIYCVEDERSIRELIVYALKSNGYDAVGFSEGGSFF